MAEMTGDTLIDFEQVHIVTIQGDRRSYATVLPQEWSYPPKGRETFQCSECGSLVIDQDAHLLFHLRAEGKQ